jgi:hypothetical protein
LWGSYVKITYASPNPSKILVADDNDSPVGGSPLNSGQTFRNDFVGGNIDAWYGQQFAGFSKDKMQTEQDTAYLLGMRYDDLAHDDPSFTLPTKASSYAPSSNLRYKTPKTAPTVPVAQFSAREEAQIAFIMNVMNKGTESNPGNTKELRSLKQVGAGRVKKILEHRGSGYDDVDDLRRAFSDPIIRAIFDVCVSNTGKHGVNVILSYLI